MALRFSREEKGKFLSKSTPSEYFSPQGKEKFSIMKSHEFEEVARAMSEDVSNTPYGYVYKPLWDSLWNARVPGRVKICAWKASMDILPTRAHLHQKGMSLKHRGCMFCDDNSLESSLHVLKDCPYATSVWFSSALAIRTSELQCITVKDWLLHLSIALPASQFAMLMMTLWSIWNERHSLLLGKCKKLSPPDDVARRAQTWLQEFMTLPQNLSPKPLQPNQKWSRPNEGWVKVNVDGVYDRAGSSGGIGVILRDWNGDFHGALTKKIYGGLFSQVDVEVVALREGVRFALDRGYHQVWFESDALNTIIARYNIEYHREEDDEDVYISDSSSDSESDSDTENDSDGDTAMPESFTPVSRVARMVLALPENESWATKQKKPGDDFFFHRLRENLGDEKKNRRPRKKNRRLRLNFVA
ncbi:hypothetical protein ACLB2K_054242 [Fragaria x ananassa]